MNRDIHKRRSRRRRILATMRRLLYLCAGIVLLSNIHLLPSFALDPQKQISQYGYSVWSRQNGLPANAVRTAIQTRDGYLWLGTTAGLLRFDGVRFVTIKTDTADEKNRELITALCESRDSTLWIGTAYDGLRRLKNGKLLPCSPADGFPNKSIKSLLESREGHLWIGSSDGLFEYIDGRCVPIPVDPPFITSLTEDAAGRIFVGSGKGVHYFDEAKPEQIRSLYQKDGLPHNEITSILAGHHGVVGIGTQNGFALWSNGKIISERISENPGIIHVTSICEDHNTNIWLGTTQGIYRFSGGKWTNFKAAQGFLSDNIYCLMEDREGSIWICTSEGLCRFRDVNITSYTTQEGLVDNFLTSVLEGSDRSMYLFSAASGGSIIKLKDGILTRFPRPPHVGPSYLSRDGSIWTSSSGFLSNIKNDTVVCFDTTSGLPNRWISAITEDSLSLILYFDRIGVRRFLNGKLKPYLLADGREYSSPEYVSCFYMDRTGILWIGTTSGLVKIQNGKCVTFRTGNGLSDDWIRSFYEDRQGHLWLGSPRGGLIHYRDGKFISYDTKNGLFTNKIYCVLIDDSNDVWISSPEGVGRLERQEIDGYENGKRNTVHPQAFSTADGMRTDECFGSWQPSGWKASDGRIWFATTKGAVVIDPKTFKRNSVPPPISIEQFIADVQPVRMDQEEPLSPGTKKLEFHYTALSYLVPDRVFFKYLLEGYDPEWVDAGTRRVAYYTNLPPGKYKFRVIACNNDGVWNERGADLSFELLPHFYQTTWFYSFLLILIGGIIIGVHRWRIWQHVQVEQELEQRVYERTKQLEVANQELEAFSYSVSHDLRAPLRGINGFSTALSEDYKEKLDKKGNEYLDRVRAASQHMEHLIDDLINLSRVMRCEMSRSSVNLSSIAEFVAKDLQSTEPDRQVTFVIEPGLLAQADRNLIEIVLANLLENAWKFTCKHTTSQIEVGCTHHDGQKVYFVRDDGDGFDMAYAAKLFGAFQRMHTASEFKGTGIGLATVRRIIHRHGGRIWAEAEKNKGATFYFTLP